MFYHLLGDWYGNGICCQMHPVPLLFSEKMVQADWISQLVSLQKYPKKMTAQIHKQELAYKWPMVRSYKLQLTYQPVNYSHVPNGSHTTEICGTPWLEPWTL